MTAEAAEALEGAAIVQLIRCRLDELREAGCEAPECVVVAARLDVRLKAAVGLIAHGCPPELVLPILL